MTDVQTKTQTTTQATTRTVAAPPQRRFQLWPPDMPQHLNDRIDGVVTGTRAGIQKITPAALWRDHRIFTIAVCLSIIPRFIASMGFKPALFIQDSFSYLSQSIHLKLGQLRPAGYPMMLRMLEPFHSLLLVTTVQHIMGIALAAISYVILRTRRLPAWGATLATVPTLFDSRQIWLESSILPDTLFTLVLMIAVAVLILRPKPKLPEAILVGLLIAYASVIRGNGAPVFVVILVFLLIRRVGWRVITACVAAFAVPLLGYVTWFHGVYGQFDITNSSGLFLWSRTMSFADCSVIKPPRNLRPLCPQNQPDYPGIPAPAWSTAWVLNEPMPADYLWDPGVWYQHDADPGINAYNNKLALEFAERAILAQPVDYVKTVGAGVLLAFLSTDRSTDYLADQFTVAPHVPVLAHWMSFWEKWYGHTPDNTHPHQPWAYLMFWYQLPVWFPGWVFLAVFVAGLGFAIKRWRRGWGGYASLAWGVGFVNLVVPIAAHELDYRYALSAVPFACLALGLGLARKPELPALPTPARAAEPRKEAVTGPVGAI